MLSGSKVRKVCAPGFDGRLESPKPIQSVPSGAEITVPPWCVELIEGGQSLFLLIGGQPSPGTAFLPRITVSGEPGLATVLSGLRPIEVRRIACAPGPSLTLKA